MTTKKQPALVGVFPDPEKARQAVQDLRKAGFTDEQIGVMSRNTDGVTSATDGDPTDSYLTEGAATGVAAGAGIGALWGLGILAGVMPVIGPAIAGGALAAVLTSAAAGAAAAGLAGALVGMGIPKDEAEYYESEVKSGRTLVTVAAGGRESEVRTIFQRYGGFDRSTAESSTCHTSSTQTSQKSMSTHSGKSASGTCATGGQTVKAVEEELRVEKKPVQSGEVKIRKEVHTEHKTIDVPVMREEVVVERTPACGTASDGDMKSQEIRIPLREEEVRIEKTPVVKEEVSVSKRQVQGTKHVSEDVRKETIKVDTKGSASVREERKK